MYDTGETNEALRLKYNPEGSDLRELQHRLLDMLLYLRDICNKLGISYYLDGGTLLGAVRHGGFIPWDDDLDIVIDVKDLKKLEWYMRNNSHPNFFYMDRKTEKYYYMGWPKLADCLSSSVYTGPHAIVRNQHQLLEHTGISVDIFPYSDHVISWLHKIIHRLYNLNMKYVMGWNRSLAAVFFFILFHLFKPIANICGYTFCKKDTIAHDYLSCNTVHRFRKDHVYPLSSIEFEGHFFNAPKDVDYYLKTIYDDYMSYPPESQRHHHDLVFKLR